MGGQSTMYCIVLSVIIIMQHVHTILLQDKHIYRILDS